MTKKKNEKSVGHYCRGDKRIDITWGDKISESLREIPKKTKTCKRCGKKFKVLFNLAGSAKYCSKECSYHANDTEKPPLDKKILIIGANLLMGKGKSDTIRSMLEEGMKDGCPHCGCKLTLKNITVDHKTPYGDSKSRRNKKENKEIRMLLDRKENLETVCVRCNQLKGSMNRDQYTRLRKFLSENPDIKEYVETRLMRSTAFGRRFK